MAIVLHKHIKVYDVNKYLNVKQLKPAFERLPIHTKDSQYSLAFKRTSSGQFHRIDLEEKNNRMVEVHLNPHFMQRSLEIYSEISRLDSEAIVQVQMQRIYPYTEYEKDWRRSEMPQGLLCVEKENLYGGLDQFKMQGDIHYSEIDYEMAQGYIMVYDHLHHKCTPISCNYKDIITYHCL